MVPELTISGMSKYPFCDRNLVVISGRSGPLMAGSLGPASKHAGLLLQQSNCWRAYISFAPIANLKASSLLGQWHLCCTTPREGLPSCIHLYPGSFMHAAIGKSVTGAHLKSLKPSKDACHGWIVSPEETDGTSSLDRSICTDSKETRSPASTGMPVSRQQPNLLFIIFYLDI